LSFLGIGVPDEVSTWGSILNQGRQEFDAWWMVVFPGLAIFLTIFLFNSLGERIRSYRRA
jgi:peptide/nickel transport system permease protein